jgi:hypothetical protein
MNKLKKRGLWEAVQAIGMAIAIGLAISGVVVLFGGCAGGQAYLKYEHHSSIPDFYDKNTADMVGFCIRADLGRSDSPYRPSMEGCINEEVGSPDPVFGEDPSGELSIRVPLKVWK